MALPVPDQKPDESDDASTEVTREVWRDDGSEGHRCAHLVLNLQLLGQRGSSFQAVARRYAHQRSIGVAVAIDAQAVVGFAVGIAGTVSAFGAKYAFDFRLGKRRLELDERAALTTVLGGRPGQLRRSSIRMKDRVDGFFREDTDRGPWLVPASSPGQDGYLLRSSVQRVFLFLSCSALMQQALDSLPAETLRARQDLQYQYALIDLSMEVQTNISMFDGPTWA